MIVCRITGRIDDRGFPIFRVKAVMRKQSAEEWKKALRSKWAKEGMEKARAAGKHIGRPLNSVTPLPRTIKKRWQNGESVKELAERYRVHESSIYRRLHAAGANFR